MQLNRQLRTMQLDLKQLDSSLQIKSEENHALNYELQEWQGKYFDLLKDSQNKM